jgi:hypothetical protein
MGGVTSDRSSDTSDVWSGQSQFLTDLYQQGANQLGNFQPNQQVPGMAMDAWQQQLNPQMNPHLDQMSSYFGQQLGQANQMSGGEAGLTGGYGGGRHGVANHLNQQQYGNNMGNFLGQQYQGDMNRQQQAVGQAPMMMGMDPQQQQNQQMQQYKGLLGNPTVLGQGSSSGSSLSVLGKS